jgi:hypothetical protein
MRLEYVPRLPTRRKKQRAQPVREHGTRFQIGRRGFYEVWIAGTKVHERSGGMQLDVDGHLREGKGVRSTVVEAGTPEHAFVVRSRLLTTRLPDQFENMVSKVHEGARPFPIRKVRGDLVRVDLVGGRYWEIWTKGNRVITRTGEVGERAGETVTIIDVGYREGTAAIRDEILAKRGIRRE